MSQDREARMKSSAEIRNHPEFVAEWDVYRDPKGQAVTITEQQSQAIWHAIHIVENVRSVEGHRSMWISAYGVDFSKSRLLGRMLIQGRPPTKTKPPLSLSGPDWSALPGGDPFRDPDVSVPADFVAIANDSRYSNEYLGMMLRLHLSKPASDSDTG